MNRRKHISASTLVPVSNKGDITHLIDLFVDLCFEDISSIARRSQFVLLGQQLGYQAKEIEDVVALGLSEYNKLLGEINQVNIFR